MRSYTARTIVQLMALLICFTGAAVSHFLVLKHAPGPVQKKTWVDTVCTKFETSSCDEVLKSRWAELPIPIGKATLRIPTASAGSFYFVFMLGWFFFIGPLTAPRWWVHFIGTLIATVGLGFAVFLDVAMFTTLPKWCPLCVTTHVASLLIFVCMLLLWPRRPVGRSTPVIPALAGAGSAGTPLFDTPGAAGARGVGKEDSWTGDDAWPHWTTVVAVPAIALLVALAQFWFVVAVAADQRAKTASSEGLASYWESRFKEYDSYWQHTFTSWLIMPRVKFNLEGVPARGPANATHTIVIFGDFQCPACGLFETQLNDWIVPTANKNYGGIKVVFKHWPLCPTCNKHTTFDKHPKACIAARAAEAARLVGGDEAFWKMHDLLFASREVLKEANEDWFVQKGQSLGLNADAFRKAMNSQEAADRIAADAKEGEELGKVIVEDPLLKANGKAADPEMVKVDSTPAIYVDGKKVRSTHHKKMWQMILGSPRYVPQAATAPAAGVGPLRPPEAPAQGVGPLRPPEPGPGR